MNDAEYRLFLAALSRQRSPYELRALADTPMIIWDAGDDPTTGATPSAVHMEPFKLAERWLAGRVRAVSVEVDGAVPRNRCVFNCSDGSVQESGCDNDPQDIQNCMDAVKGRCTSSGAKVTTLQFGPGMLAKKSTAA